MQTKMRQEWTFVTPAMAAKWLENNPTNRTIKAAVVSRISRDIEAGHFVPTHQGVALYEDGSLADGQHRLMAIVGTGVGAWTFVCHNVPLASRLMIDGGNSRTAFDALTIAGTGFSRKMAEIATSAQFVSDGSWRKMSRIEIEEYIRHYEPGLRYAAEQQAVKTRKLTLATIGVVLFRAWYTVDKDRLTEFSQVILTGKYQGDGDEAAVDFREYLLNDERAGTSKFRQDTYGKCEAALRAFLRGEKLKSLRAVSVELFPLPPGPWDDVSPAPNAATSAPSKTTAKRRVA